eukprot:scaffold1561_cov333-Pavlova_lutheri.AAC.7
MPSPPFAAEPSPHDFFVAVNFPSALIGGPFPPSPNMHVHRWACPLFHRRTDCMFPSWTGSRSVGALLALPSSSGVRMVYLGTLMNVLRRDGRGLAFGRVHKSTFPPFAVPSMRSLGSTRSFSDRSF